jgi:acyl-CoA synthetase (AMP-forming)/AMP-acid ligase II
VAQSDLLLMKPEQFVRAPLRYLRCFAQRQATLSVTANFAIEYLVRHISPQMLQGFDFRHWKALVVGAERVDSHALREFERLLQPHGFAPTTLLPAYGMAEASLAISGAPLRTRWRALDAKSMTPIASPADPAERSSIPVVSCGKPLEGVLVEIVDSAGRVLPDQEMGEIVVRSKSLAQGYQQSLEPSSLTRFTQGRLFTGDIGFTDRGELFVLGRFGDSLKIRGQFVFGEDLEIAAAHVGIPRERIAALLGYHEGRATVVLLVERFGYLWPALEKAVRHLVDGAELVFLDAPPGSILRTTSGKPKRRELWQAFAEGRLTS